MSTVTHLYRLFDKEDRLLYVGISKKVFNRINEHMNEKSWASEIAREEVTRFANRGEAMDAEIEAIKKEQPLYNIQHQDRSQKSETKLKKSDDLWAGMTTEQRELAKQGMSKLADSIFDAIKSGEWTTGKNEHYARYLKAMSRSLSDESLPSEISKDYFGASR
jgi:predicted GIY-YIG superfamily endonuclease